MDERRYDVVFRGELVPGEDPGLVRQRLTALFKGSPQAIERLFTGQPAVIRRAVDESTASRYRDVLRKAGALCHVVAASGDAGASTGAGVDAGTTGASGELPPPSKDLATAVILPAGTPFDQPPPPDPPEFDFEGLSLAEAGGDLIEYQSPPAPDIDTSRLSVAPPGADLLESGPTPNGQ